MLRKYIYTAIVGIFAIALAAPALANVNESWDWHLVDGEKKRTLHYCAGEATRYTTQGRDFEIERVSHGVPDSWALWITEAVDNWNNSGSGWELVPTEGISIPPCQVLITLADINEGMTGGGGNKIIDIDGDGKVDLSTIVIDTNLEETLNNLPGDQDQADGNRDGWSTQGDEQTRDPVGVLKHELSHSLRMDHHEDSKQSDTSDPDVSDPRKPGDHTTDLSDADKQQASDAFGEPVSQGRFTPCTRRNHFNYNGIDITFEAGTFSAINSMTVNPLTGIAVPDPLQVPEGYSYVMNPATFFISTALPPLKPLTIRVPYTESELEGGQGKWIHDYHGLIPPSLDEETITLVKYIQEPFGQEIEGMSHWEIIEGATLDTENNTVTFQTTETGIFGLTAKALPGELTIDEQIAFTVFESGASDKKGEEAAKRPLAYTIIAIILLVAALAAIIWSWQRKKK